LIFKSPSFRVVVTLAVLLLCETAQIIPARANRGPSSVRSDARLTATLDSLDPVRPLSAFFVQSGKASYYASQFHGRRTASGSTFDMNDLTAAHRTLPFGSILRVTNPDNETSIIVQVNDRGPFVRSRVVDLSRGAARCIGVTLHKVKVQGFVLDRSSERITAFKGSHYEPVTLLPSGIRIDEVFSDFSEAVRKHRIVAAKNRDEEVFLALLPQADMPQLDNEAGEKSFGYAIVSMRSSAVTGSSASIISE